MSLVLILWKLQLGLASVESESICDTNRVSSYLVRLSVKGVDVVAGGRRECVLDSLFPVVVKHVFGVGNGDLNRCVSRLAKVETVSCAF